MSLTEYKPGSTFPGWMGRTVSESEPAWPAPLRSESGAPNVVYIVLDDTGYGQFGCYGSPGKPRRPRRESPWRDSELRG